MRYDLIGSVYDWPGFDAVQDTVFRELAIARILEPISKADAGRVLADLGATVVSYKTIQRDLAMKTSASTGTPSPASASRMPLIAVD